MSLNVTTRLASFNDRSRSKMSLNRADCTFCDPMKVTTSPAFTSSCSLSGSMPRWSTPK